MVEQPAGTVTLVFTDIEGSTRLLQELGQDAYRDALGEHRRIVREAFERYDGYEVDYEGDAFFYAFASAPHAVAAVAETQQRLADGSIRIRIGIHTGTPGLDPPKYVGMDVHRAARIMSAGHGGQVLISKATREIVDVDVLDLGEHRLKDFDGAVSLFQLGEESFPPLKTISNTNLPRPASSFVGREREVGELVSLLRQGTRLVTLTGPGGTGKTRLAIEAAAELVPEFEAGAFWVGLATLRDPSIVTETIAQTLGAKDELAMHIGERQMLLLLDNFEQVVEAAPALAGLVEACPNLVLLLTSRELLRVRGEVEYEVLPLRDADGVELFCARAKAKPDDEVEELCRRLDNMPLALELAAARATVLTVGQIVQRLSQRLDLFRGGRDVDPRQQTLRATIEWSHDLLTAEEQSLFARLAVFAGGCSLEAAEAICQADLDTCQSLLDKSLLRFADERYWMLETIRDFAAGKLDDSTDAAVLRARHADWLAELIEEAEPELEGSRQQFWLETLEKEHDNIRAALRWTSACDAEVALRLAGSLATFWWVRGHWTEGRRWLDEVLSLSGSADPEGRAKALEGAANLAYRQGDDHDANTFAEESLCLRRQLGEPGGIARSLRVVGLAAVGEDDNERLRAIHEESAEYARAARDSWALSMALNNLAISALRGSDFDRAAELLEEASALASARGDRRSETFFLRNLALAEVEQHHLDEAHAHYRESLLIARELEFVEVVTDDLEGIAVVLAAKGKLDAAARLVGGAALLRERTGSEFGDVVEERAHLSTMAVLERGLDPSVLETAIAAGRDMTLDDLVEFALDLD